MVVICTRVMRHTHSSDDSRVKQEEQLYCHLPSKQSLLKLRRRRPRTGIPPEYCNFLWTCITRKRETISRTTRGYCWLCDRDTVGLMMAFLSGHGRYIRALTSICRMVSCRSSDCCHESCSSALALSRSCRAVCAAPLARFCSSANCT